MNASRIRAGLVLFLMLLSLAGAYAWRPSLHVADTRPKVALEQLFPTSFGAWQLDTRQPVQLIAPDQAAMLSKIYNETLSRTYVNSQGDRIMLSVAYGGDQSDGTRAHRPEVCYPAQGFQISNDKRGSLALAQLQLPVRHLVARQGGRIEPITYWVVIGERIALSGTEQKLAQLSYSTRGLIPDGMLVRVSSIDADEGHAYTVHARFVADMAQAIAPALRDRVLGQAAVSGGGA